MTVCRVCCRPVSDDPTVLTCSWDGKHQRCPVCKFEVNGPLFNGRCFDCHEQALRPVEDWASEWASDDE